MKETSATHTEKGVQPDVSKQELTTFLFEKLAVPGHALLWLIPVQRKLEHATW
jgi:hypothetical protein